MAWVAMCDTAHSDPLVLKGGLELFGFAGACASWSAEAGGEGKVEDFFIPDYAAQRIAGAGFTPLIEQAIAIGWFTKPRKSRGDRGWFLTERGRKVLNVLAREQVLMNRERNKTTRQKEAVRDVRLRDGDQCRYCRKPVDWTDRVSGMAGTYDHPVPADRDTFVVACKACNSAKGKRTPEQWMAADPDNGKQLLPPPAQPHIGPVTAKRFSVPETAPMRAQQGAAPERSASASRQHAAGAQAVPEAPAPTCDLPAEDLDTNPDRAGPGRVGQPDPPHDRASPARRTRRGTRGGTKSPPDQRNPKD